MHIYKPLVPTPLKVTELSNLVERYLNFSSSEQLEQILTTARTEEKKDVVKDTPDDFPSTQEQFMQVGLAILL